MRCSSRCIKTLPIWKPVSSSPSKPSNAATMKQLSAPLNGCVFNPNLPRVKLELGVLYFKLGSYELARSYFQEAVNAATPLMTFASRSAPI